MLIFSRLWPSNWLHADFFIGCLCRCAPTRRRAWPTSLPSPSGVTCSCASSSASSPPPLSWCSRAPSWQPFRDADCPTEFYTIIKLDGSSYALCECQFMFSHILFSMGFPRQRAAATEECEQEDIFMQSTWSSFMPEELNLKDLTQNVEEI